MSLPLMIPAIMGIACIGCGCCHFHVTNTVKRRGSIIRYRRCRNCGRRVVTTEKPAIKTRYSK